MLEGWRGVLQLEEYPSQALKIVMGCEYNFFPAALVNLDLLHPVLASSVESTVVSPKISINSSMRRKGYES